MVTGLLAVTSAQSDSRQRTAGTQETARPLLLAVGSALSFGVAFFVAGNIKGVDPAWVVGLSRVACIIAAGALCVGREPIAVPKHALYWAAVAGCLDAAGYIAFIEGSQYSIPIAAITTSQWAGIAVIIGILMLRERLTMRQALGVVLLVAGTAVVAIPG
jgi:drug/metabolite transporter (DMT)-like permease